MLNRHKEKSWRGPVFASTREPPTRFALCLMLLRFLRCASPMMVMFLSFRTGEKILLSVLKAKNRPKVSPYRALSVWPAKIRSTSGRLKVTMEITNSPPSNQSAPRNSPFASITHTRFFTTMETAADKLYERNCVGMIDQKWFLWSDRNGQRSFEFSCCWNVGYLICPSLVKSFVPTYFFGSKIWKKQGVYMMILFHCIVSA